MGNGRVTKERLHELFELIDGKFVRKIGVQGFRCEKGSVAGSNDKHGYTNVNIDGVKYKCHRLVWLYVYGRWPEGEIDHINRVRDDNRPENLREANSEQQKWNTKIHSHNRTGVKGVSWDNSRQMFRASITVRNKFKHLGFFKTLEEASNARLMSERIFREVG